MEYIFLVIGGIILMTFGIMKKVENTPSSNPSPEPSPTPNPIRPKKSLCDRVSKVFFHNKPHNAVEPVSTAIEKWCEKLSNIWYKTHPTKELVAAIAMVESTYGKNTYNPLSSAAGVMQITKDTVDTINNIIRAKYPEYIEYSYHTHEFLKTDIDSNIMHACILLDYIIQEILNKSLKLTPSIAINIAPYVYHYGLKYIDSISKMNEYDVQMLIFDDPYTSKVNNYMNQLLIEF